jgi:hypothetical protein
MDYTIDDGIVSYQSAACEIITNDFAQFSVQLTGTHVRAQ